MFTPSALQEKLVRLSPSQDSIRTISMWMLHYRKHMPHMADIWFHTLVKAEPKHKLKFIFLLNDLVLMARKQAPEVPSIFASMVGHALEDTFKNGDHNTRLQIGRMVNIWDERQAFAPNTISDLRDRLRASKRRNSDSGLDPKRRRRSTDGHASDKADDASGDSNEGGENSEDDDTILDLATPVDSVKLRRQLLDTEKMVGELLNVRTQMEQVQALFSIDAANDLKDMKQLEDYKLGLSKLRAKADEFIVKASQCADDGVKSIADMERWLLQEKALVSALLARQKDVKTKADKIKQVYKELESHLPTLPERDVSATVMEPLPDADDLFS